MQILATIIRIYFVIMPLLRDFLLSAHIFAFATSRLTRLRLVVSLSVSGTQIYLSNKKADGFLLVPKAENIKGTAFRACYAGKKAPCRQIKKARPKNIKSPCFTKRPPSGKKQTNTARFFFSATIFSADRTVSTRKEK